MAHFDYRGRDRNGSLVTGQLEAASIDAVASQLNGRGIAPLTIEKASSETSATSLSGLFRRDRVKPEDVIMFARQMYTITRAGIPLVLSVRGLADTLHNRLFRDALYDVAEQLEAGMELSAAMTRHPKIFTPLIVNIVRVGEDSGRLDEAFLQLHEYLEQDLETSRRIKAALRYPSFVLIALVLAMVVINIFVIPAFSDLFAKFQTALPLPTRILIGFSDFFIDYWPHLLVATIGVSVWWYQFVKTDRGSRVWGRKKLSMPIVGSIVNRGSLARYTRCFSMMLRSGVPLPRALNLCSQTLNNNFLADKVQNIRAGIERGENIYATHLSSGMFTPLVLQMISVGEASGQVEELLANVADYYEREVEYDLKTLTARLEPIIIIVMAAFVLLLALGIMLPVWQMYSIQAGG